MNKFWIAVTLSFLLFGVSAGHYSRYDTEFSREKWEVSSLSDRYRMALYLERNDVLIGKTTSEVALELGAPAKSSSNYLFYLVNQPWGFKDGFSLTLIDGKVVESYVHD